MRKICAAIIDTWEPQTMKEYAIEQALKLPNVSMVHVLSDRLSLRDKRINHIEINRINNAREYCDMVLTELYQFCSESHMLIFQWDGFVLSPDKWTDEFLNYDYIGAPWIPGQFPGVNNAMVGNSGFSLISQKLFGLIKMFKLTTTDDNSADDTVICLEHRELLERHGINFAPLKLAAEFSIERHKISNLMQGGSLGFHGSFNLPDAISEELLIQSIPEINHRLRHHLEDLYMLIVVCELRGYRLFINEYFKEIKNSEIYKELYRIDHSDAPISRLGRGLFLQRYFLESSG